MRISPFRAIIVVVVLLVVVPGTVLSGTLTVRQDGTGDFTTIVAAVAAAAAGDVIDGGPGTYTESVFIDKSLTVVGTSGLNATTVDGLSAFVPITLSGTITVHLEGLTVSHGLNPTGTAGGGVGIRNGVVATITGCHFEGSTSHLAGGAVFVMGPSRLDIDNCSFAGNHADGDGGAGYVTEGGVMTVMNCTFVGNTASPWAAALGNYYSTLNVSGCLFAHNVSTDVAGAIYYYRANGYVTNSTFYNNSTGYGPYSGTIMMNQSPSTSVTYCIMSGDQTSYGLYYYSNKGNHSCNVFWNNAKGPIYGDALASTEVVSDPRFCSPMAGSFYLAEDSPAAPGYNDCGALIGA